EDWQYSLLSGGWLVRKGDLWALPISSSHQLSIPPEFHAVKSMNDWLSCRQLPPKHFSVWISLVKPGGSVRKVAGRVENRRTLLPVRRLLIDLRTMEWPRPLCL